MPADGTNGVDEVTGTTVGQVIPCNGSDYYMFERQADCGFSDTLGFMGIQGLGKSVRDCAKGTTAGANVTHN